MAIVGTAFVRLKVIGDKLANDIGKQVQDSVESAGPDLDRAGKDAGDKVGKSIGDGVKDSVGDGMDKIADDIGTALGNAMAESMGNTLRKRIGKKFREGTAGIRGEISRVGNEVSGAWTKVTEIWGKRTKGGLKKNLGGAFMALGGLAFAALPSILAFGGAIAGALAATVITGIAAIGPAAAGAAVGAVAAFAAIKISAGLLGLAMKYPSDQLTDFQERANTFKGLVARPIQAGLLSGLNASMRLLTPAMERLNPQFTRLGIAAGDVAIGFADSIRQGAGFDRISRILDTNNQFITDAGGGVSKLAQAFIIVLDALRPVTTEIGQMAGEFGDWALRTAEASAASGTLSDRVLAMWNAFKYFVGILWDFGVGIANVFRAAFGASDGMLTSLHDNAAAFRAWTGDTANQDRMTTFFTNMRTIAGEVLGILGQLGGAAGRGLEGTNVDSVLTGLNTLVSVGQSVGAVFEQIRAASGPALGEAFRSFADLLIGLAESGVLGVLAQSFAYLFQILAFIVNLPLVGELLSIVAGLAVLAKTFGLLKGVMSLLRPGFMILRVVLMALVGVFGWIPIIIAAVVAALIWFFTQTEIGRDIIQAVWNAIVAAFNWAKDAIMTAINAVWGFLKGLWNNISGFAAGVWNVIRTVFTTIYNFYVTIWSAIFSVVSTVLTTIWNVITTVMQAIWNAISGPLNVIYGIWRAVVGLIVALVVTYFQLLWGVISTVMQLIWLVISTVWGAIWGFIEPIISMIWNFIVGAWDAISGAISTAMSVIWGIISSVWNTVWGFISGILGTIGDFISGVWEGISSAVGGFVSNIWETISDGFNNVVDFIMGIPGRVINLAGDFLSAGGRIISGLMDGIANGISAAGDFARSVVNKIIDFLNSAIIDGINNLLEFTIPVPGLPDIDINPPDIPRIPHLALGGTISPSAGGTLALVAEAGRSERVEPLDPQGLSRRDRAMIEYLGGGQGGGTAVHVYIGERELTEIVDEVVEDREGNLADRVLTGTKG